MEQSACNTAGLWGQESSSSDQMGKEAASVGAGSELARAGAGAGAGTALGKQVGFSVSRATFVYFPAGFPLDLVKSF